MKTAFHIKNRSGWPDWFAIPVARWVAHRAGIYKSNRHDYTLEIVNTKFKDTLCGRSYGYRARVRVHRRFTPRSGIFPYITKYWTYKWSMKYALNTRIEAFVDIIAHEMFHSTGGRPALFRSEGRTDRQSMEMACERFSKETVEEFRKVWPGELKERVKAELRRNQIRTISVTKSNPDVKLQAALDKLAVWQKKLKLANTKIKKYKQQVNYYQKRSAAKKGS